VRVIPAAKASPPQLNTAARPLGQGNLKKLLRIDQTANKMSVAFKPRRVTAMI